MNKTQKVDWQSRTHVRDLSVEKEGDIATLWFDCPGKVNVLGNSTMQELRELLPLLEADHEIKALIIASRKTDTFISGADLHEIMNFQSQDEALALSRDGQKVFNRLAALPYPVVVAIHGPCLGGGLEAALCGSYRIATDSPLTVLGLPEVKLGLIPGLGGTQRLPQLIEVRTALELILTSEIISAAKARELGIVDELVVGAAAHSGTESEEIRQLLLETAKQRAKELISGKHQRTPGAVEDPAKLKKLFATMERSMKIRLKGHYPAPLKAIEAVKLAVDAGEGLEQKGLEQKRPEQKGLEQNGLAQEAKSFAELAWDETSGNLIQLFFAQDFISRSAARNAEKAADKKIKHIGIVGSGIMGAEIARLTNQKGLETTIKTSSEERLKELTEQQEHLGLSGVHFTTDLAELKDCDMVIEAVIEDSALKQELLSQLETVVSESCLLVTNTSSMELVELAQELKKPDRFVGLHFFYPVDKMPLVELISHPSTSALSSAKAVSFLTHLEKVPISVKDSPGFLVNRLLTTHLMEASHMLDEGIPINWIEESAVRFGLPMGPFTLVDELGLPLCIDVAKRLHNSFGKRFTPPRCLHQTAAAGLKGKLSGGCYIWEDGRKKGLNPEFIRLNNVVVNEEAPSQETIEALQNRLIYVMIDEAARCLEEKVVRKPRELDLALVLGAGFPPFRGGLLRFADSRIKNGMGDIVDELLAIYRNSALNFREVSSLLLSMRDSGRRFYSSQAN